MAQEFQGHTKKGKWFFAKWEEALKNFLVPRVPSFLETYHLTLMTLAWSAGIVLFGF